MVDVLHHNQQTVLQSSESESYAATLSMVLQTFVSLRFNSHFPGEPGLVSAD